MWYLLIIGGIILLEMKIKSCMELKNDRYGKKEILKGKIILEKYHNKGMCLNLLENKKNLVLAISGAIVGMLSLFFAILLPRKGHKVLKLSLAFLLGGAISNLLDRIQLGYVVDYFSFRKLKKIVFNLADMFIFLGGFMTFLLALLGKSKAK